jgi:hypothetical protein
VQLASGAFSASTVLQAGRTPPCAPVVFGASGDLTAFFRLHQAFADSANSRLCEIGQTRPAVDRRNIHNAMIWPQMGSGRGCLFGPNGCCVRDCRHFSVTVAYRTVDGGGIGCTGRHFRPALA